MCEGKRSGGYPELGSTITSAAMMWSGAHMLLFWRTEAQLLSLIGASFVVNGWSAMISHAGGGVEASAIDRWSMIFTAWLVMAFVIDEFTQSLVGHYLHRATGKRRLFGPGRTPEEAREAGLHSWLRLITRGLGYCICTSISWICARSPVRRPAAFRTWMRVCASAQHAHGTRMSTCHPPS